MFWKRKNKNIEINTEISEPRLANGEDFKNLLDDLVKKDEEIEYYEKEIRKLKNTLNEAINIIEERIIEFDEQGFFEYPIIYDELLSILKGGDK